MSELAESLKERGYSDLRIVSSKRIAVLTNENRKDLLQKLAKEFSGTYNPSNKISSIGHVDLAQGNIILTKSKTSGGSGAGADITKLGESAQCVYAAAKFYNDGDYSSESLLKSARSFTETDEQDTKIANKLTGDWQESSVAIAEKLFDTFGGSKRYKFYRGKGIMSKIEKKFQELNRVEKEFSNINKWSPADIWMATEKGKNIKLDSYKSILELNGALLSLLNDKDLVGISLKKSEGNPKLKYINVDKNRMMYEYKGYITNKGPNYFSAKDHYIKFNDGGEIQLRTFAPTWQGEIKGKYANQGKVSGGPIGSIVKRITGKTLTPQRAIRDGIVGTPYMKLFFEYYKFIVKGGKVSFADFQGNISLKNIDWQISKFLGAECLYHMIKTKKEQQVLNSILGYASSQSELSAPYVKLSDE